MSINYSTCESLAKSREAYTAPMAWLGALVDKSPTGIPYIHLIFEAEIKWGEGILRAALEGLSPSQASIVLDQRNQGKSVWQRATEAGSITELMVMGKRVVMDTRPLFFMEFINDVLSVVGVEGFREIVVGFRDDSGLCEKIARSLEHRDRLTRSEPNPEMVRIQRVLDSISMNNMRFGFTDQAIKHRAKHFAAGRGDILSGAGGRVRSARPSFPVREFI